MKKLAVLLIFSAGWAGLLPVQAATITRIKAVSQVPGSNPPFQAELRVLDASAVGEDWRVIIGGTYQADLLFSGTSGIGLRTIDFGVSPNSAATTLNLEGRAVTYPGGVLADIAACRYRLGSKSASFPVGGGSGSISVQADRISGLAATCAWTTAEDVDWITLQSGLEGTGDGTVSYTVDLNACGPLREGRIVVAGLTFTVTQAAAVPTVTIVPGSRTHPAGASDGHQITVVNPCGIAWTAVDNAAWVHITSGSSGSGNGTVFYRIDANGSIHPRSATIQVGTRSFAVNQEGITCDYSVTAGTAPDLFPYEGGTGCLAVATSGECGWTALAGCSWVDIETGNGGTGPGSICIEVAENLTTNARACVVNVSGASYTVRQEAGPCQYWLSPDPAFFEFPNSGGSNCVDVIAPGGCEWTADVLTSDWIRVTSGHGGVGSGTICFEIEENTNVESRTGTILVQDQVVTVHQVSGCTEPCGSERITERQPVITWCPVDGATWHQLHLEHEGTTFFSQWIGQEVSEYIPENPLPCGDFTWWVRSWGPDAGMGAWQESCSFQVEGCCTPGVVMGMSPDGTCEGTGRITYSWDVDPCASWYRVWVGRDGRTFHDKWYETGFLPSGTVSRAVFDHVFGSYTWWMVGWGPDGLGTWTGPNQFTVGAAIPVAPVGNVSSPVTLSWNDDCSSEAAWYHFFVSRNGRTHWSQWIPAIQTSLCGDVRCLSPMGWPPGNYTWWMRAWMPGGMGPWSQGMDFVIE